MSEWVHRAIRFTQLLNRFGDETVRSASAADPLTVEELTALQSSLSSEIPSSLADFLLIESGSCNCEYNRTIQHTPTDRAIALLGFEKAYSIAQTNIYGGASLCQSECFGEWNSEAVISMFDDIDVECADLWRNSFIFKAIANGDSLGLYVAQETRDPPVVYLDHEGEIHRPIAPSLAHFLREWETLCYVGPEIWMLEEFIDQNTGYLDSRVGDLDQLTAFFK